MKKQKWNLNKSQRMQLKALACVLGILLLLILMIGRLVVFLLREEKAPEPEPEIPIPVITYLENVWIMEVKEEELLVFREGGEETYPYGFLTLEESLELYMVPKDFREQVADITLTDGYITEVRIKAEKVNGKVLSAGPDAVELEGFGKLPLAEDVKGYRLYDSLEMCTVSDIAIGYDFNDFILEDGKICAILMVKEEAMEYIRILLKASDYSGTLHESVTFTSDAEFVIKYGEYGNIAEELHEAGEECTIDLGSSYFQSDRLFIIPKVLTGKIILSSVNRSQGIPSCRGIIELVRTEEGIAVINEVLLEEYLYSVIPSEMPSSYPEEALKAQAICARTYAYSHMLKAGYPVYGAHLDDSTSYQVYNNIVEHEAATTAAKETYGQLLYTGEGDLAGTYYYSTSCGLGSDAGVWKSSSADSLGYLKARAINYTTMEQLLARGQNTEAAAANLTDIDMIGQVMTEEENFAAYIRSKNDDDFECTEGWYRWTYTVRSIDEDHILEILKKRYVANDKLVLTRDSGGEFVSIPIEKMGSITDIYVEKRGSGGIADELIIETDKNTFKIISEHNIRYVLNDGKALVYRQDGSEIASANLLPSGFFVINTSKEKENVVGYTLIGGGYGHGVGMSQNGARAMAKAGYQSDDILKFFYEGCYVRNVYGADTEE